MPRGASREPQRTPTVRIESPALAGATVQIEALEGVEAIGKLFDFRIELVCNDPGGLDDERLLAEPANSSSAGTAAIC